MEILNIWKNNLGIDENTDFEFSLCSNHFVEECFDPDDPNHELILPGAVPTLFCADPEDMINHETIDSQHDQEMQAMDQTVNVENIIDNVGIDPTCIKMENVQMTPEDGRVHTHEPQEEVIHPHDLMQMVHNNALLQQNSHLVSGEHVIEGLDNGDQMNTIIIQQEVGEQEVVSFLILSYLILVL